MPGVALQQRLTALTIPADYDTLVEVRALVWAFVDDRKAIGWPPERIIIAVKQIAREAGLKPSSFIVRRDAKPTTLDEFLVEMVGWCIERYYRHRDV